MTANHYLTLVWYRTGIPLTLETADLVNLSIDKDAREMALTYRMLGYVPDAAAVFLRRYYLLETT